MYMCVFVLSCFIHIQLFATLWTVAHWAPLSLGFSRQEYWSGLPCPSPGDPSNPGIEPGSPALQADSLQSEPPGKPQPDRQAPTRQASGGQIMKDLEEHDKEFRTDSKRARSPWQV